MHALYRNHMGSDLEVVQDARISFDATTQAESWDIVDIVNPCENAAQLSARVPNLYMSDQNLIGFLARGCRSGEWQEALDQVTSKELSAKQGHDLLQWIKRMPTHWTPFGQQVIKLRMKAPVPIRTQCFKSKIGMVENEESRRYIDSTPELFVPEFRSRPEGSIKQGSGGIHPDSQWWRTQYISDCQNCIKTYEAMIKGGVAPEQARFVLPQGVYVNWVWTGSLYAYAEFYNKRADSRSQGEIQDLAKAVAQIIEPLFPVSWRALTA